MNPVFPPGKFHIPPARPRELVRVRLLDILTQGEHRPLALIRAPAGFGKTTLAADWARRCSRPVAWFAAEEDDGDPARFLAGLRTAVASAVLGLRGDSMADAGDDSAILALLAELEESDANPLIVIDDAHLIAEDSVWRMIGRMAEHLPARARLLMATREEPRLPLARLRVRDGVTEINASDLQFTADEGAHFLSDVMGLNLPPDSVALVEARTEGWAAGLQLAALTLRGADNAGRVLAGFSGRTRLVEDYLFDEVFSHQTAAVRAFLLRTSVLRRMTPALCEALAPDGSGVSPARETLMALESAGLFTQAVDDRREWFRYHPLFADLLRARLEREHPGWIPDLHRAAAEWHESVGGIEEAIHHALAVPDPGQAARLMERCGSALINDGRIGTLIGWLRRLPEETIAASAYLCVGAGWAYVLAGDATLAERYAEMGSVRLADYRPVLADEKGRTVTAAELEGDLETIRAYAARLRGDEAGMRAHTQRAFAVQPADAAESRLALFLNLGLMEYQSGDLESAYRTFLEMEQSSLAVLSSPYAMSSAVCMLGEIRLLQGRLTEADAHYRRVAESREGSARGGLPSRTECMRRLGLSRIAYERHRLAEAEEHAAAAREAARGAGDGDGETSAALLLGRCALANGDSSRAEDLFRAAIPSVDADSDAEILAFRSELWIAEGDLSAAEALWEAAADGDEIPAGQFPLRVLGRARVALARRDYARILSIFGGGASAQWPAARVLAAGVIRAAALRRTNDSARAAREFAETLSRAAPEGILQPFRIGDPVVRDLLQSAVAQGAQAEFAQRVLETIAPAEQEAGRGPLTERELQILRLLASGRNSTEVAADLVLAVSTVRTYIKEIHRKLDAHSREEALAAARRLNLL